MDMHPPQVGEEYYRKSIKSEEMLVNWKGVIVCIASSGVIQKIAVKVCPVYYQLLNGTLVMRWQTDLPNDTQYLPPSMSSLE